MAKSMTGFGLGECFRFNRRFKVEMKSVNHRFSDFTIKLPRFLNPFEDKIRRRLSEFVVRGKVDVWISFESFTPKDMTVQVNHVYADAYMDALNTLALKLNLGQVPPEMALEMLSKVPDIILFDRYESALESEQVREEMWEALEEALDQALASFNGMRTTEGAALEKDIWEHHAKAVSLIAGIRKQLPLSVDAQAHRLRERLNDLAGRLGGKPDEEKLLTEIAHLTDKGDISEELTRMDSHFEQLSGMISEKEATGRKMDFLVQEMNREANTIGSKSNDIELTKNVVELKSVIEKIREQVQNIE